jgi:hypothetical protein
MSRRISACVMLLCVAGVCVKGFTLPCVKGRHNNDLVGIDLRHRLRTLFPSPCSLSSSSQNNVRLGIQRRTSVELGRMQGSAVVLSCLASNSSLRPFFSSLARRGLAVTAALGISAFSPPVSAIGRESVMEGISASTAQLFQRSDEARTNTRTAQTFDTDSELTPAAKLMGWQKEADTRTGRAFYVNHEAREWSWEPPKVEVTPSLPDVQGGESTGLGFLRIAVGVAGVAVAVGAAGVGGVALRRIVLEDEALSEGANVKDSYRYSVPGARGGGGGNVGGVSEEALEAARQEVKSAKQDAKVQRNNSCGFGVLVVCMLLRRGLKTH